MPSIAYPDLHMDLYNSKKLEHELRMKCLATEEKEWLEKAFIESLKLHNNKSEVIAIFNKILEPTFKNEYIIIDRSLANIVVASDEYSRLILTKLPMLRDRFLTRYQDRHSEPGRVLYLTFYPNWDEHFSKKPEFLIDILLEDEYLRNILFSWHKEKSLAFIIDYKLNKLIYHRSETIPDETLDHTIIALLKMIKDYQLLSVQDTYDKSRILEIQNRCKSNNEIVTLCDAIVKNPGNNPNYEEIDFNFYVPPVTEKPTNLAKQSVFSKKKKDTYLGFEPGFLIGKRF